MPRWLCLGLQDFRSISIIELTSLHDYVIVIILLVVIVIRYVLSFLLYTNLSYKFLIEGGLVETIWSVIPAFILLVLVVPSIKVLYLIEDILSPSLSVKVVGHQWYWSYVVPFLNSVYYAFGGKSYFYFDYDSILEEYSVSSQFPRLLGCSDFLNIPVSCRTRLLISSSDVIHSFAVPSLGLKVDALPGRINQLICTPSLVGVYFGQCSEICGSNHSFMPIGVKVLGYTDYLNYTQTILLDNLIDDFSC